MTSYFALRSPQQQVRSEINRISRQIGSLLADASQLDWGNRHDPFCSQLIHESEELKRQINRLVTACQGVELSVPIINTAQALVDVLDTIVSQPVDDTLDI